MIWNTIADTNIVRVRVNFEKLNGLLANSEFSVFLQENPTIEVLSKQNAAVLLMIGDDTFSYVPDENKMVYINMTEYFAAYPKGSVYVATPISSRITINYRVVGNVSSDNMIIPIFNSDLQDQVPILQPRKQYELPFGLSGSVSVFKSGDDTIYYGAPQQVGLKILNYNSTNLPIKNGMFIRWDGGDGITYTTYTTPMLCNRLYAAVKWTTKWGGTNIMTWEVVDLKQNAVDIINLAPRYNEFISKKGYEQSFILRLDGLSKYDYWYYSDIITSNDVRVALSARDSSFGDDTRVEVVTKSVTIPNANGLYRLDVEIKYKHYDRV